MSLRQEMRVIPKFVLAVAILAYLGVFIGLITIAIPQFPDTSNLPRAGMVALGLAAASIPAIYLLLLGYVYGDAKRRGMRSVMWTLLAIFVPYALGFILYFIFRDPLPVFCPHCGASVKSTFVFCPRCAAALRPTCQQCGGVLERGWAHCPHCGSATPSGQAVVRTAPPAPGTV
jgi:Double zinc ribbon/Phospholipase_D-nuclease N-terminal